MQLTEERYVNNMGQNAEIWSGLTPHAQGSPACVRRKGPDLVSTRNPRYLFDNTSKHYQSKVEGARHRDVPHY